MYAVGDGYSLDWSFALSFVSAPILSLIFAFILSLIFKSIFSHLDLHLIKLAYYMRTIVVICIIFTAIAIGFNWGGFIIGLGSALEGESQSVALVTTLAATAIAAVMMILNRRNSAEYSSGVFADFSIYSVLSVGFAVVITLFFFSFDLTTSLLSLSPVPLSASTLIMAAIGGVELAQRLPLVDREEYMNEATGFVIAPLGSFMLTHILISVIDADVQNQLDDFAVLAVAVAVLMALAFAGYVRLQRRQKEATDKLVYTQQQQIYENSRALNDMELKVVISENQALHNAVEMKKQEVINVALSIVEQREYLESLNQIVARLSKTDDTKEKDNLIAELKSSLNQRLSYDRDVDSQYFYAQAESLHEDFNAKLSENFPDLTPQERRLATLLRLGFSSKYIATLMNITPKSVEISRYRLRQKLGLEKGSNLVNFIKSI
jgi:DNA-binding NarL/FixJ family response regulator